ncbi:glycoside hydrolase 43 family protein [Undibacterium sp. LX15W]|uniref:Glycoside hydrolase 43 family protein n=2 Tax=Undibacterium flavidum TaxID=2762297 RepID=A0ABR6YGV4_9BURK|nr:glycoside hydrolase 43 family protein [Undibacterium flavidum]
MVTCSAVAQVHPSKVWKADLGNGRYRNPIIHADYSDPDVIRVGKHYYMTASSFNSAPGLPLLQSDDMIHWKLVGHALPNLVPTDMFASPQHGKGVWAPSLRFHDEKFWIFYPDPDVGIYVITAKDFAGPWSTPHLLIAGKGLIDPTPLWDEDGKAWLLHAWAKSRAGFNNQLTLRQMAPDASTLLDEQGILLVDGNKLAGYKTLEGPKFYKYQGWYYIFAPAGGVETGWQTVFRSRQILGPYEDKIVLAQGSSRTNGPHQGAWVRAEDGSDWFYHFQDRKAYGRIVHLQPMRWENAWPVMGVPNQQTGIGEPVAEWSKPIQRSSSAAQIKDSDDFTGQELGLQWQWNANWQSTWYSLSAHPKHLRLYSQAWPESANLGDLPSILLQKIPAPTFTLNTSVRLSEDSANSRAGLVVYGQQYVWAGLKKLDGHTNVVLATCTDILKQCQETITHSIPLQQSKLYLRLEMKEFALAQFSYSLDGRRYQPLGKAFTATAGRWVGAKLGLFSIADGVRETKTNNDYADFSAFRFSVN